VDGTVVNDLRGDLAEGSFKYRGRGSLAWTIGPVRVRWTTTVYGSINDSNAQVDQYRALLQTVPNAEVPMYLFIDDVWEHDLFASLDVPTRNDTELRVYAGINNVTNAISPFLPTGTESGRLTNQNSAYDVAGRRFYVGATLKF
jgi:hypothetical protein